MSDGYIGQVMLGFDFWAIKEQDIQKMSVAKTRILKWMSSSILKDKIRNEYIHKKLEIDHIENKLKEPIDDLGMGNRTYTRTGWKVRILI